jgi:hypothetical protein
MRSSSLVYPMFAMVLLSFVVLLMLYRRRVGAVKAGAVSAQYFKVYQGAPEPEGSAKVARQFANLFESPTLFYAGCLAAMLTGDGGAVIIAIAWLYVAARIAHALIHLGANRLRYRIRAFFASWVALMALWVHVVTHLARPG